MTRGWRLAALAAALLGLDGCAFWHLRKDVERMERMALVGGRTARAPSDAAPIVVALVAGTPATVVDTFVLDDPGAYFFIVPAGTYRIAAFVDRNRDGVYQPATEPAAYHGAPTDVRLGPGEKLTGVDVLIGAEPRVALDFPISVANLGRKGSKELPPVNVGEIVTFDDPRFAPENGEIGLWRPVEFLFDVGAGFYFLEPYDAKKTPVLFVHGAGGTPRDWRYLVERLDRKKFQPWLLYYPTGLDLDVIARGGERWIGTLVAHYHLTRIVVVAHSMGGLVARAAINRMVTNGDGGLLATFVTISTPWGGYAEAAKGVEHAPVVMPMWRDMAPGSAFLADVLRTPLPEGCPYYMFFSYKGDSLFLDQPNDGVVTIASELAFPAQLLAKRMYGFDESHLGILRDARVAETLDGLLASAAR